jgi:DNA-binding response OmpR family regulator
MRELQATYVAGLNGPITALQEAVESGANGDGESVIRRIAHQLRGSGESFGYPEISRAAGEVLDATAGRLEDTAGALLQLLCQITADAQADEATALIVEDDPAIRLLLDASIAGLFDHMQTVETLAEAREWLAESAPSVVLLDLALPDGDGRALLAEIRSRPELAAVRIAVMSAHGEQEIKDECARLGADGYFQKPFSPTSISDQVADLLAVERPAPVADDADELQAHRKLDVPPATRILFAEDDPLTADLVLDRLKRGGFDVMHCEDGQAALEAARHREFAAAVIDVNMPRMNGFELLARLRGMRRHKETPVLVLTAMGDENSVVRAFDLGADDYVLKPFSPSELTARIARLVAS